MKPEMLEALYQISLLTSPDPEIVFRQILEVMAGLYGNTMAMINVVEDDCLRCRALVNPHRAFQEGGSLNIQRTLCRFPLASTRPLLIQNARVDPDFRRHIVVALKLNRYLGVPICAPTGNVVGTLCLMDNRTEELLDEEDIRFLSLLAMRVSAELERAALLEQRVALLEERNTQLDRMAQEQRVIAQQLADLNTQMRAQAEEKRHFVNMVIHDLRHPLTSIRTTLSLLALERHKKQRMADLRTLENRTRALNTLLDELVLYDRIEHGRSLLCIEPIDLATFLPACVEEITGDAEDRAVPVRCEIAADLGDVALDRSKLRHILLNLISNALKFTQEGCVTVRARPENAAQWRLEVEDTGTGMTSTVRERAFEEYFSGAGGEHSGIGLGLAIAHRLATALEAKMTLRSLPGQGTLFQLIFPRCLHSPEEMVG